MLTLDALKDFLLPEIQAIRQEQGFVKDRLNSIDTHLVDQSRRIDAVREELGHRIDETNKRLDQLAAKFAA